MNNYGIFTNIVANAGAIMAVVAALGLAWRGRTKWEPSEEDVPKAPQKVAGLLSAVAIAVVWASFQQPEHAPVLSMLALTLGLAALVCLCAYVFLVASLTYSQVRSKGPKVVDQHNIIGGFRYTEQSLQIINEKRRLGNAPPTPGELFKAAGYNPDRVWTRPSRAIAKVLTILFYVGLIATGTVALASAAILIDVKTRFVKPVSSTSTSPRVPTDIALRK